MIDKYEKSLEERVEALEADNQKLQEKLNTAVLFSTSNPWESFLSPLGRFFLDADRKFFEVVPVRPDLGGGDRPDPGPACRNNCFINYQSNLQSAGDDIDAQNAALGLYEKCMDNCAG